MSLTTNVVRSVVGSEKDGPVGDLDAHVVVVDDDLRKDGQPVKGVAAQVPECPGPFSRNLPDPQPVERVQTLPKPLRRLFTGHEEVRLAMVIVDDPRAAYRAVEFQAVHLFRIPGAAPLPALDVHRYKTAVI